MLMVHPSWGNSLYFSTCSFHKGIFFFFFLPNLTLFFLIPKVVFHFLNISFAHTFLYTLCPTQFSCPLPLFLFVTEKMDTMICTCCTFHTCYSNIMYTLDQKNYQFDPIGYFSKNVICPQSRTKKHPHFC